MLDEINPERASHPDRDRRVRQADRLGRILNVLHLIQGRGKCNVKSIASELEVTERTVYRDLQALEFAGVPWYYDADSPASCIGIRRRGFDSSSSPKKEDATSCQHKLPADSNEIVITIKSEANEKK